MRLRVFGKIYASFLLVVVLISTLQLGYDMMTQSGPFFGKSLPMMDASLVAYAKGAAEFLRQDDRSGAQDFIDSLMTDGGMQVLLLSTNGTSLLASRGADILVSVAKQALATNSTESERFRGGHLLAMPVATAVGELVVAADFPSPHGGSIWKQHVIRLSILLLVSAGVCFVLAKYLTAPIRAMSHATRLFASGRLDTRMTSLSRRTDEFGQLASDFDRMATRIESLLTSQRQLLGDISHELRSPLARLGVALDLLRRDADPKMEQSLTRIGAESESLNDLIGELLSLTRMEQGAGQLVKDSVDLVQLLMDVVDDGNFEAQATERSVIFNHWEPCTVHGDAVLLTRAVENVIRNAIRHAPAQSEIEVRLHRLTLDHGTWAEITIRDHGPGVDQEYLSQLFEPFFRVSKARERSSGGSGLGLAIAHRAVVLHHGLIWAENASGGGLLVIIRLPQPV